MGATYDARLGCPTPGFHWTEGGDDGWPRRCGAVGDRPGARGARRLLPHGSAIVAHGDRRALRDAALDHPPAARRARHVGRPPPAARRALRDRAEAVGPGPARPGADG